MPRIPYGDLTRCPPAFQSLVKQNENAFINIFKMYTNSPTLAPLIVAQGSAQFAGLSITPYQRELLILVTAQCADSAYEWLQHVPISQACGVNEMMRRHIERLASAAVGSFLRDEPVRDVFPKEEDRILLHFAQVICRQAEISDKEFKQVQAIFNPQQIVEMIICHGFANVEELQYYTIARASSILRIEVDAPKDATVANLAAAIGKEQGKL